MLPVFPLISTHKKPAAIDHTKTYVTAAGFKFALRKTHGLRPVTTTTALMKHQLAVFFP
jgi:uncharacterized membrane protein YcgQ (UPF0703/DUF1980 family)